MIGTPVGQPQGGWARLTGMTIVSPLVGGAVAGILTATAHATPVPDPTPRAPEPASARPDTVRHSGPWDLVLVDVRVGSHDTSDRVVLEFEGRGVPGWRVEYVDTAVLDGIGHRVRLAGESILQVGVTGTEWPGPDAEYYDGPDRLPADPAGALSEVYVGGTFEGHTQLFVGIDGDPADFDVFALEDPARLVVDLQH